MRKSPITEPRTLDEFEAAVASGRYDVDKGGHRQLRAELLKAFGVEKLATSQVFDALLTQSKSIRSHRGRMLNVIVNFVAASRGRVSLATHVMAEVTTTVTIPVTFSLWAKFAGHPSAKQIKEALRKFLAKPNVLLPDGAEDISFSHNNDWMGILDEIRDLLNDGEFHSTKQFKIDHSNRVVKEQK